jgi:hypothetical protein
MLNPRVQHLVLLTQRLTRQLPGDRLLSQTRSETMPSHHTAPLDRMGLQIGDQVLVLANTVKMAVGTVGTITGFSSGSQHPLVAITARGRFLIPACSLERLGPVSAAMAPSD